MVTRALMILLLLVDYDVSRRDISHERTVYVHNI